MPLEGGVLPLPLHSVARALSQRALSMLLPGPVQVTFSAAASPPGVLQLRACVSAIMTG